MDENNPSRNTPTSVATHNVTIDELFSFVPITHLYLNECDAGPSFMSVGPVAGTDSWDEFMNEFMEPAVDHTKNEEAQQKDKEKEDEG